MKRRGFLKLFGVIPAAVVAGKAVAEPIIAGAVRFKGKRRVHIGSNALEDVHWVGYDGGQIANGGAGGRHNSTEGGYMVPDEVVQDWKNQLASDRLDLLRLRMKKS